MNFSKEQSAALLNVLCNYESESSFMNFDNPATRLCNLQPLLSIPLNDFLVNFFEADLPDIDPNKAPSLVAKAGSLDSESDKSNALCEAHDWLWNTLYEQCEADYKLNSNAVDWEYRGVYPFNLLEALKALHPLFIAEFGDDQFTLYKDEL